MQKAILIIMFLGIIWPQNVWSDNLYDFYTESFRDLEKEIFEDIKEEPSGVECDTKDGYEGKYVPLHQCGYGTDGDGQIDIRFGVAESGNVDVCCKIEDIREPNDINSILHDTKTRRTGCGLWNPDGVDDQVTVNEKSKAKFGEFPWMVVVFNGKKNLYVGGGSLIHASAVLTAAHYVKANMKLKIRAGEWNFETTNSTEEIYKHQDRDVKSVAIHEDFDSRDLFNDIAILFLKTPVDLKPHIGIVCLPPPRARVPADIQCMSSGWGKDKFGKKGKFNTILKKVNLPVVDLLECQNRLRKTRLGRNFQLHSSFMCAGGEPGKDTCEGDGGSPLVCPIELHSDRYMQSGIVAWGIGCSTKNPGVYTDVSEHREWIDEKMNVQGLNISVYTF